MKYVNPVSLKTNKTLCIKGLRSQLQRLSSIKNKDSVLVGKDQFGDYIIAELVEIEDVSLEK